MRSHVEIWMLRHGVEPAQLAGVLGGETERARRQVVWRLFRCRTQWTKRRIDAALALFSASTGREVSYEEAFLGQEPPAAVGE